MKIFLSIKYHADHHNRGLIESIAEALQKHGHETACIVRDAERWGESQYDSYELMELTFEVIRQCDGVLVELSEKGVGIGIEAGYAYALGKPIWVIARQGADISETLRGIAAGVRTYQEVAELEQIFLDLNYR